MAKKIHPILALIFIILIPGGFFIYGNSLGLFSVLPAGEYNSNADCSFITNANYVNGESSTDYGTAYNWISVDVNKDGTKEGYGMYGSTGSSGDACRNKEIIANTPIGLRVVIYSSSTTYTEIAVCSTDGKDVHRYRNTDPDALNAILTCCKDTCLSLGYTCGTQTVCGISVNCGACSGQNNIFRTTDLTYAIGSALAFTQTCGNSLTAYGYYTTSGTGGTGVPGNCFSSTNDLNHYTKVMDIPGTYTNQNWIGTTLSLYTRDGTYTDYVYVCVYSPTRNAYSYLSYKTTDSDASKVSTSKLSVTPANELICDSTCTPNWICSGWTTCINLIQTQTCTDSNSCGVLTGKPIESQSCTVACTPKTCSQLINPCGTMSDGCTGTLNCGVCSSGTCVSNQCTSSPSCTDLADTNCDGVVNRTELGLVISKWISNQMTRTELGNAIQKWSLS